MGVLSRMGEGKYCAMQACAQLSPGPLQFLAIDLSCKYQENSLEARQPSGPTQRPLGMGEG